MKTNVKKIMDSERGDLLSMRWLGKDSLRVNLEPKNGEQASCVEE